MMKMYSVVLLTAVLAGVANAQFKATRTNKQIDFACPVQVATTTVVANSKVMAANAMRMGFCLINDSTSAVRYAFDKPLVTLAASTVTSTGLPLNGNTAYCEGYPGVNTGEVDCQTVGTTTVTIHAYENQ